MYAFARMPAAKAQTFAAAQSQNMTGQLKFTEGSKGLLSRWIDSASGRWNE